MPLRNSTSTCPKSCWLNSPGRPSKRTSGYSFWSQRSYQSIQGGFAARITGLANSPENFQRRHVRLFFQDRDDKFPEILNQARSADLPLLALGGIIDMHNRSFFRNALHRTQVNSRQTSHFGLGVTSLQQNLDFVTL